MVNYRIICRADAPSAVIWRGMIQSQKHVRENLAEIGRRAGRLFRESVSVSPAILGKTRELNSRWVCLKMSYK